MNKNYAIIGRKLNGIICKGNDCQGVDLPKNAIIICRYSDFEYIHIPNGYTVWIYNDSDEKDIPWIWTDAFDRVYNSMWSLLTSIEEEEGKFIAVSSIVEDLKPYIGRITVYGDRSIPKMAGFSHTFRGMTRNIDFYDNTYTLDAVWN